jgi:hypothetical protein
MKKIILATLLLGLINCKGQIKQTDNSSNSINTMENFDIKKYNENQNNHDYLFTDSDGNIIRQWDNNDLYISEIQKKK